MNEPHTYKSGKLFIRFTTIQGVNIYMNAGSDYKNASEVLVPNNGTVTVNKWYKIDQSSNFIIVIVPRWYQSTDFKFEYYTEGVKEEWYYTIYYNHFTGEENEFKWYGFLSLVGLLALLVLCMIFCCFYQCCKAICGKKQVQAAKNLDDAIENAQQFGQMELSADVG